MVKEEAIEILYDILDPEIKVNIYDLGMVYGLDIQDDLIKIDNQFSNVNNNKYKILEPIYLDIPTCITDIEINNDIIKMIGKLEKNEKYNVEISFDKQNKIISVTAYKR